MVGTIVFGTLALIAVLAALGMLTSTNAVHAALFLVVNFTCVALFYLGLDAPFLAMVQITVYAGAIMVLFLFVIMLLGAERLPLESRLRWQTPLALLLVVALLGLTAFLLLNPSFGVNLTQAPQMLEEASAVQAYGSPRAIGIELFIEYMLPFQLVGVLLLVAMVGAVVLAKDDAPVPMRKRDRRLGIDVSAPAGDK